MNNESKEQKNDNRTKRSDEEKWDKAFKDAKRLVVSFLSINWTRFNNGQFSREAVVDNTTIDLTDKEIKRILDEKQDGLHKVIGNHLHRKKFEITSIKIFKESDIKKESKSDEIEEEM